MSDDFDWDPDSFTQQPIDLDLVPRKSDSFTGLSADRTDS
jgi:hypothetical protein